MVSRKVIEPPNCFKEADLKKLISKKDSSGITLVTKTDLLRR